MANNIPIEEAGEVTGRVFPAREGAQAVADLAYGHYSPGIVPLLTSCQVH